MKQVVKQVAEKVAELNTKEIEGPVARLDMRQAVELDMTQAVKPVAAQMPRIRTLPAGECRFWPTAIALRRRAQYNPTPHLESRLPRRGTGSIPDNSSPIGRQLVPRPRCAHRVHPASETSRVRTELRQNRRTMYIQSPTHVLMWGSSQAVKRCRCIRRRSTGRRREPVHWIAPK